MGEKIDANTIAGMLLMMRDGPRVPGPKCLEWRRVCVWIRALKLTAQPGGTPSGGAGGLHDMSDMPSANADNNRAILAEV